MKHRDTLHQLVRISVVLTLLFSANSLAQTPKTLPDTLDKLTEQWLNIEQQDSLLLNEWQQQKPSMQQRILLLKAEKSQLNSMLSESSATNDDVESRRNAMLTQQNTLESQQQQMSQLLSNLAAEVDALYTALPDIVKKTWDKENSQLDSEAENSQQLQVMLAKLSSLQRFDQNLTINEVVMTAPDGKDVLMQQLYIGVGYAWMTNANGQYRGVGRAEDGYWVWQFKDDIDAQQIINAIAIFKKKQTPEFVSLPLQLATNNASQTGTKR